MKTNNFLKLIMVLIASYAMTSCVQDDDYSIPNSLGEEENERLEVLLNSNYTEVSFADVKAMYQEGQFIEAVDTDIYVKGYVSSSDKTGNFFKEFFIQDSPTNPTAGLKIILNQVDSYNKYNLGREVYINLKDLYIGEERVGNGVIAIGGSVETNQFGTTVVSLNENQIERQLLRSTETIEMTPLVISFSEISNANVGMLVAVENVEFAEDLDGLRYFDPTQVFDTKRTMQSCDGFNYNEFQLETSGFSSFKNILLPTGNGTIAAVVSKTFDGASLVLALNSTDDVSLDGSRCSLLDPEDFSDLFVEDFESMSSGSTISGNGWTAYAEEGSYNWRALTTNDSGNPGPGNKIASMGAYNSGVLENITWLISPVIDLDAQDLEFINFQSSNSFSDGSELELLISTDWDGNTSTITSSTWTSLPGTIVSDDTFFQDWVDSGLINLSSYSGNAYIAFKYVGGDDSGSNSPNTGTIDGTYEIDNYRVLVQD